MTGLLEFDTERLRLRQRRAARRLRSVRCSP
jgi:hypothetical protein